MIYFCYLKVMKLVHLPAPKTHYNSDISFTRDIPIFCTAKEELSYVSGGILDTRETEMMRVRWRVFSFRSRIKVLNSSL